MHSTVEVSAREIVLFWNFKIIGTVSRPNNSSSRNTTLMPAKNRNRCVRYGDYISISADVYGGGGYLAANDIPTAALRILSNVNSAQQLKFDRNYRDNAYPDTFFSACIFKIDEGVGYDASGQYVRYGSTVRLILVSTQEYVLSTLTKSNSISRGPSLIELRPISKVGGTSSNTNFVVLPSYNIKTEGEIVCYDDLIQLQDVFGNYVLLDANTSSVLTSTKYRSSFRFANFLPVADYNDSDIKNSNHKGSIKAGDVIRLFHKQDQMFLLANVRPTDILTDEIKKEYQNRDPKTDGNLHSVHIEERIKSMNHLIELKQSRRNDCMYHTTANHAGAHAQNDYIPERIDIVPAVAVAAAWSTKVAQHVFQFWMIELVEVNHIKKDLHGLISTSTPIRLRHVITDAYLAYDKQSNNVCTAFHIHSPSNAREIQSRFETRFRLQIGQNRSGDAPTTEAAVVDGSVVSLCLVDQDVIIATLTPEEEEARRALTSALPEDDTEDGSDIRGRGTDLDALSVALSVSPSSDDDPPFPSEEAAAQALRRSNLCVREARYVDKDMFLLSVVRASERLMLQRAMERQYAALFQLNEWKRKTGALSRYVLPRCWEER